MADVFVELKRVWQELCSESGVIFNFLLGQGGDTLFAGARQCTRINKYGYCLRMHVTEAVKYIAKNMHTYTRQEKTCMNDTHGHIRGENARSIPRATARHLFFHELTKLSGGSQLRAPH